MDTPQFPGFEIIETMPRGGMSTVYKARQISLDRVVALKSLSPALSAESADINQFLAEARITAQLKHPNIVQIYDFGKTEEGNYYFVMEFVSGYSVGDWIRRKQFIAEDNALLVAQSVAEALNYAWKTTGIIHCDVKPDNLIIDGDGTVKVADLGLAKSVQSVVDRAKLASGVVFGTPNYISPEQSRGDADLDCRTDIYSLGATLYHCLTGKMPFEGIPAMVAMDLQITDQIPAAQDINPRISDEAAGLMEKMMAKDRQHRQADWDAVQADINRVMKHQQLVAALPQQDVSTMRRSVAQGPRQRMKVAVPAPAPVVSGEPLPDSTAFRNMERQFALKQKQKRKIWMKPEWWFAGVISFAVLILGILVARSIWLGRHPSALEGDIVPPPMTQGAPSQEVSKARALPAEARIREDNAREMFDFARKWAQTNPSRVNEAIRQYEKVVNETRGTKYSLMAAAEVQKLQESRQNSIAAVMEALAAKAGPLIEKNEYTQAADIYEHYQGEWAVETVKPRANKIQELRERESAFRERQKKVADEAQVQWRQLLDRVGSRLVAADVQDALTQVQQGAKAPEIVFKKTDITDILAIVTEASRMDQRILNAFRTLKDQEVTVVLTNGVEKLTIRDVQADIIQGEKIIILGEGQVSQPKSFRVVDLALSEKRLRLGSDDKPESALMRGVLSVKEQDWESAASCFAKTGPLLSPVLSAKLAEKKRNQGEDQAWRVLQGILRNDAQVDVARENTGCEDCLAAIRNKKYTPKEAQTLAKAVEAYRADYGQTRIAKQYEPVLMTALARVEVIQAPERESAFPPAPTSLPWKAASPASAAGRPMGPAGLSKQAAPPTTPEAIKAQLLERNPGLMEEHIVFQPDESGKIFRLEIVSPALKDIRPLAGLADLRELVCRGTPANDWQAMGEPAQTALNDLSPLRGMALIELDVSYTMVKDLAVLTGMPLSKVNLGHTRVTEILCLKGAPLTELNLQACRIRDISLLREMPLTALILDDTDVADLTPLKGLPLVRLSVARTKVRDLSPLTGMQIRVLDISGTEVKDVSLLKYFPLKCLSMERVKIQDFGFLSGLALMKLNLAETEVRDISMLKGMPLQELDLQGTRVRDLTSLQGMPLEVLNLNRNFEIKELAPLKNMPLKMLGIMQTQVKDITPLQDLPIESIWLDFNTFQPGDKHWFAAVLRRMPMLRQVNGQPWGGGWGSGSGGGGGSGGWRRKR